MKYFVEFYRRFLLEFLLLPSGNWDRNVIYPDGQTENGTGGETLEEAIKTAKQDVDILVAETEIAAEIKPIIDKLLDQGHKPWTILRGLSMAISKTKQVDWQQTQSYLNAAASEFNQFEQGANDI